WTSSCRRTRWAFTRRRSAPACWGRRSTTPGRRRSCYCGKSELGEIRRRRYDGGYNAVSESGGQAMPVHDWTRVDAGTFHAFPTSWITHLMETLNAGRLPRGYYALSEQVASRMQTDLLTLRADIPRELPRAGANGGVAVAEAAPRVRLSVRPDPRHRPRRPAR